MLKRLLAYDSAKYEHSIYSIEGAVESSPLTSEKFQRLLANHSIVCNA
jgi:hypothetical protein